MSNPRLSRRKIDKYYLNLAGEYRVCAELLKRGIFATVTFGNMKGADIIAVGPNRRAAVIEVKASNSTRFVTGFYQKYKTADVEHPAFWVLYSVRSDGDAFTERFFVLSHEELGEKQAIRTIAKSCVISNAQNGRQPASTMSCSTTSRMIAKTLGKRLPTGARMRDNRCCKRWPKAGRV